MKLEDFPPEIRSALIPTPSGLMMYRCLGCKQEWDIDRLLYTCPYCGSLLLLFDKHFDRLKESEGRRWREIFDYRRMINYTPLKGIFRYYEFMAPVIPLNEIIYLGEGHTPLVKVNRRLQEMIGLECYFKNDGLNPSASFKDRGMVCALSFIRAYAAQKGVDNLLAICASTGDTSASAALYAAYLQDLIQSAVILPHGKVTPSQLAQPLGNGARVLEVPGVFDDCMKIVESLAEDYEVALLNSKNSWRILGQESYSYEIAQDFDYHLENKAVVLPIGNAGNITAVMNGFLKFHEIGVIEALPKIIGVQSAHADPVFRYYQEDDPQKRKFEPVAVKSSVAQAAMIGNPVSMPRVMELVETYNRRAGMTKVFIVQVEEQEIMDAMIIANRNGNIVCTQGGESMAGLQQALHHGMVNHDETAILDSTAHMLKFLGFQEMYFHDTFPPEFEVRPRAELKNAPVLIKPDTIAKFPSPGRPLRGEDLAAYVKGMSQEIAQRLSLKKRS